nr:immunoglobulin light chain junction region [Macaca mulatta]MOW04282.1 immunoglobulin light chain junction region [Macaca mulatta]MOW04291.1 immunoglobulin light chain junction region [Macaca mulatta]MOW04699.1 immunoglobulin light chain junction region [Macaca mulatta]MOW05002.1 immunoglobulin light chain junction region [Macaca mulatta]
DYYCQSFDSSGYVLF